MEVQGRASISRTKGTWSPNPRVRFEDDKPDNAFDYLRHRARSFRHYLSDTFCMCCDAIPSIGLMLLALLLLILLIGSIPLAVFLTYMAPDAQTQNGRTQVVPMIRDSNVSWPDFEISEETAMDIIRSSSLVPKNISSCKGFGFACTSHPDMIIGTNQRCDGHTDCPDGSDEYDCKECQTIFTCPAYGFQSQRKICLRGDALCDGQTHCPGKEDELLYCGRECEENERQCNSKDRCIPVEAVCDGDAHCPDGDDEMNCHECKNGAKFCAPLSICIPKWKVCNGVSECPDGSDERDCDCRSCSGSDKALCNGDSKMCIKKSEVCDNVQHCPGGEDEFNCPGSCSAIRTFSDFATRRRRSMALASKARITRDSDGNTVEFSGSGKSSGEEPIEDPPSDNLPKFRTMDELELRQEEIVSSDFDELALDTIVCRDGKTYDWKYACSGHYPQCDGKCKQCNEELAFQCKSGDRCIHRGYVCDGTKQCEDGSDEQDCKQDCTTDMEKCTMLSLSGNRKCYETSQRCDGFKDCPDGGDEKNCDSCSGRSILCKADKKCIPSIARCDGIQQCSDGQDEQECTCAECSIHPYSMYMCERSQRCFRTHQVCAPYTQCPEPTKMDKLYCATRNQPYF